MVKARSTGMNEDYYFVTGDNILLDPLSKFSAFFDTETVSSKTRQNRNKVFGYSVRGTT